MNKNKSVCQKIAWTCKKWKSAQKTIYIPFLHDKAWEIQNTQKKAKTSKNWPFAWQNNEQPISKDYLQAWNILARTVHHASEFTFKSRKSVLIVFFNDIYWFLITKITEMHDELLKRVCIFAWLPQCIGNKVRELWCGIKLDIVLHANGSIYYFFAHCK